MKKIILCIILVVILIVGVVFIKIGDEKAKKREVISFNAQFEQYKGKALYGTDAISIINKAIDNNEKNNIPRDENGFFIENEENSLKVELILLLKDDKKEIKENTYQMETLEKAGLEGFIQNFNLTDFECTNIEYNSNNKVKKIILKQLEI